MKSIIYIMIAIFLCGIIATGLTNRPIRSHTIILQSADNNITPAALSQSADIISMRLKNFGTARFDVKTFPGKHQLQVILTNERDLKITEDLITQKGLLEFYETYDHQSLTRLLNGDSTLIKLFHTKAPHDSSARIGCITAAEMNSVNQYLNASGLNEKCMFAWSNLFDDSEACLYALRTGNVNRIPLTGSDIQSFEPKHATKWVKDHIAFKFKPAAIQTWADVTKRNVNKAIAIVIDSKVIFAPVVTSEINGGNCEITGDFTKIQVRYIAAIGACGILPADFMVVK